MQWDREYSGNGLARGGGGGSQNSDYSLVSLLTADPAGPPADDSGMEGGGLLIPGGKRGDFGEDGRGGGGERGDMQGLREQ